jgi:glutamate 5-kinase
MQAQRLVVKLGTSTLTDGSVKLSLARMADLIRQVSWLQSNHFEVVLVSSGAIAAGREVLNYVELPKHLPKKQMLAAIGQPRLMAIYEQLFRIYDKKVAQVLLTRADLSDRRRFLNARGTLEALLHQQVVPIVNENDTVATEEIRFGDNDNLSAQVANLIEADRLILLTDQNGLFTSDPRLDENAKLVSQVGVGGISEDLWKAAGGTRSGVGTGGMLTKLRAAELARQSGILTHIARGSEDNILMRIANYENIGTQILPASNKLESRKRYLLGNQYSQFAISVDNGAVRALKMGGSLLPAGIISANGAFERGDSVKIQDNTGTTIAAGLVNYSQEDIMKIYRLNSSEIEATLGYSYGDEVIHHNNMVLL